MINYPGNAAFKVKKKMGKAASELRTSTFLAKNVQKLLVLNTSDFHLGALQTT